MSRVIAIMGESGSGKTTAMRNLPPEETFYFDCDRKGLSWRGWKKQYNTESKNYHCGADKSEIQAAIAGIAEKRPDIKYIVIDTMNGIMLADEMRRMKEKGYDKWADLAQCIWDMMDNFYSYRDDLWIIPVFHSQTERDESGYLFTRIRTNGKKLDKIVPESKLTTVLLAKNSGGKYVMEVAANNSTAKTPMGAFEGLSEIDNDVMIAIKELEEF